MVQAVYPDDGIVISMDTDGPQPPFCWTRGKLIGAGAFGRVFTGLNNQTGELFAVKQVALTREEALKGRVAEHVSALELEVAVLRTLHNENIVQYLGTERTDECLNIFLEYVPGGSIAGMIEKFGPLQESVIRIYTKQIIRGLAYLHNQKIMHRDIKGANILVDRGGTIKLADFGASKKIENLATVSSGKPSIRGTPYWMAPEVIKEVGHGRPADIWSLACVVIEMATGKPPWSNCHTQVAAMYHIASTTKPPELPACLSKEAHDFLLLCFNRVPKERPNATRLLRHPWLASVVVPVSLTRPPATPAATATPVMPTVAGRSPPSPIKEEDSESRHTSPGLANKQLSRVPSSSELQPAAKPGPSRAPAVGQGQTADTPPPAVAAAPQRRVPVVVPPLALGPVRAAAAALINARPPGLPPLPPPAAASSKVCVEACTPPAAAAAAAAAATAATAATTASKAAPQPSRPSGEERSRQTSSEQQRPPPPATQQPTSTAPPKPAPKPTLPPTNTSAAAPPTSSNGRGVAAAAAASSQAPTRGAAAPSANRTSASAAAAATAAAAAAAAASLTQQEAAAAAAAEAGSHSVSSSVEEDSFELGGEDSQLPTFVVKKQEVTRASELNMSMNYNPMEEPSWMPSQRMPTLSKPLSTVHEPPARAASLKRIAPPPSGGPASSAQGSHTDQDKLSLSDQPHHPPPPTPATTTAPTPPSETTDHTPSHSDTEPQEADEEHDDATDDTDGLSDNGVWTGSGGGGNAGGGGGGGSGARYGAAGATPTVPLAGAGASAPKQAVGPPPAAGPDPTEREIKNQRWKKELFAELDIKRQEQKMQRTSVSTSTGAGLGPAAQGRR
ncbi:MAG: hypothetical protein WDW36_003902 [Sanguina aurantia]